MMRAALRPDLGASLAGLWWGEDALLRSTPGGALEGPRQSAGFAMLPYSNRIGFCRFDWQGTRYRTRPNFGDHPHSLHGVGWQRAWDVVASDARSARLRLRHVADADWPFDFEAEQRFELEPDALRWTLSLRNTDPAHPARRPGLAPLLPAPPRPPPAGERRWPLEPRARRAAGRTPA